MAATSIENLIFRQGTTWTKDWILADNKQVVTLDLAGGSTGNFRLSSKGQFTPDLPHTATATAVREALEALTTVGEANVDVVGAAGGPFTITPLNELAESDWILLEATDTLSGAGRVLVDYAPVDITGWTAVMAVKPRADLPFEYLRLTTGDGITITGAQGKVSIRAELADTQNLTFITAVYDVILTSDDTPANIIPLVAGVITLERRVS